MKKRHVLLLAAAFSSMALDAQDFEIIATHPASSGTASISVEEATMGKLAPARSKEMPKNFRRAPETLPKAYSRDGSLFYMDCDSLEHEVALSETDGIIYGTSVSRNEFGINGGIFWSPDKKKLAFYRKDESRVTEFPLLDIGTRTGALMNIRYPMNGMESEIVDLGIYDLESKNTVYVKADEFGPDRYLCGITWGPDGKNIFIQVLDRSQHHMKLIMYRAEDGSPVRTLLTEDNEKWVEPSEPLHFLKGRYDFLYTTANRDGFDNLYLCDTLGSVRRLTTCLADVKYVGNDGKSVFYTSAEVSPIESHLFRTDIINFGKARFSKPVRLTVESGWHNIIPDGDCRTFLDSFSSFNVPGIMQVIDADGKVIEPLFTAEDPLKDKSTGEIRMVKIRSADDSFDNYGFLLLPPDFDASKKYPVIVYVYGGPHSQLVQNRWLGGASAWDLMMAQKGYIIYTQDNRGTDNRGLAFEQAINRQCGQAEMADQMVGVEALRRLPFVDTGRIGVDGWSYGGFMTISLLTNYPEVFKVAVAGGPVIDWKWYEVMYGERYMDTLETNPEGFARTSLISKAGDVKGRLMIIQGAIDDTVVWEHSLSFIQECIENGIPVDYFPYPKSQHNVRGAWRVHLNQKITDYFVKNL